MKDTISRFLARKITSNTFDTKLGQAVCFVAGILVLALSFWKLTRLDLSESQLCFGILLSLCVPLLFIVVGLLLPVTMIGKKSTA